MTRNGIEYDLKKSTYKLEDKEQGFTFVFSSKLNLEKFMERYQSHINLTNDKLSKRWKININFKSLGAIDLYRTIEKRGFLIFYKGVAVHWQDCITLNGDNKIIIDLDRKLGDLIQKEQG